MRAATLGRLAPAKLKPVLRRQLVHFRRLGLTASDVVLVSYPKSGSTWLRMVLGMTLSGRELDFDSVRARLPPMGAHHGAPHVVPGGGRLLRTHEPVAILDRKPCRVLYIVRDGRDVAASYYHHAVRERRFDGSPAEFLERFLRGRIDWYGTWPDHVAGASRRNASDLRMVLVRYEDLRIDTPGEVARVCTALGITVEHSSIGAAIAANTKQRMLDKERTSRLLAERPSDGSSFVRPDGAPGWRDLFSESGGARLEAALEPGLRCFGYI